LASSRAQAKKGGSRNQSKANNAPPDSVAPLAEGTPPITTGSLTKPINGREK
jgi:hypothetical protein